MTAAPGGGCGGHAGLGAELRAVAVLALDRLGPAIDALRTGPGVPQTAQTCALCPVCVVIAALRGERPELAVRMAEQADGLIATLRAAMDDVDPADAGPPTPRDPGRRVQHIRVERPARAAR